MNPIIWRTLCSGPLLLLPVSMIGCLINTDAHTQNVDDIVRARGPDISDVSVSDGDVLLAGINITFSLTASDPDDAGHQLRLIWESDRDGELFSGLADSSGRIRFKHSLSSGPHLLTATVEDTDGNEFVETQDLRVNTLPEAPVTLSWCLPNESGADCNFDQSEAPDTRYRLMAGELPGTDVDGDPLTWTVAWAEDGNVVDDLADPAILTEDHTSKGETWTVTVRANDGLQFGPSSVDEIEIANAVPVVDSVLLMATTPDLLVNDEPTTLDTLTVVAEATDPDGDAIDWTYIWDGTSGGVVATTNSPEDSWIGAVKDDVVTVTATPNDGTAVGLPIESNRLTIANALPAVTTITITATTLPPTAADTLIAEVEAHDPDGDNIEWSYEWSGWTAGTVATTNSENDSWAGAAKGDSVSVTATPFNGTEAGAPATSAPLAIVNMLPEAPEVTLSWCLPDGFGGCNDEGSEAPDTRHRLIASAELPDEDGEGDELTWIVEWLKDDIVVAGLTDEVSVPQSETTKDDHWRVRIRAYDEPEAYGPYGEAEVAINNGIPVVDSVELMATTDPPTTLDTLTVIAEASDPDGDPITWTYRWLEDDTQVSTADALIGATKHKVVTVEATPFDETDYGVPMASSNSFVIGNSAPTAPVISLPEDPDSSDDIDCAIEIDAVDPDGDPITLTYFWHQNGDLVIGITGDVFPQNLTDFEDALQCTVVAQELDDDQAASPEAVATTTVASRRFEQVITGDELTCVLDNAGVIECIDRIGPVEVPPGPYEGMAGSIETVCALTKPDRDVRCWGNSDDVTLNIPGFPDEDVVAVGVGRVSACALTTHATDNLVCWGSDEHSITTDGNTLEGVFHQLTFGKNVVCVLDGSGTPTCFGQNQGQVESDPLPGPLLHLDVHYDHMCGIKDTGGSGDGPADCKGAAGLKTQAPISPIFTSLKVGDGHSCGVDIDQEAHCWGQTGFGRIDVPADTLWSTIDAGVAHTCGITLSREEVLCWGNHTPYWEQ